MLHMVRRLCTRSFVTHAKLDVLENDAGNTEIFNMKSGFRAQEAPEQSAVEEGRSD